jgi:hypothetical protein
VERHSPFRIGVWHHRLAMDEITYEEFGANFVKHVVTPERVAGTISRLAGGEVKAGPMPAGPGGAASVTASGQIGEIVARASSAGGRLSFEAVIPIDLLLEVRVAGADHRYRGRLNVPLTMRVRAVAPVTLIIDVDPVLSDKVEVELSADGVRAKVLQRLGNVNEEVRRTVSTIVNERLTSAAAREARHLDILSFVDKAWNPEPPSH